MPLTRDELVSRYLDQIPYAPYPVQEEALLAWFAAEQGVMVCAPTGMGKTMIAEAALQEDVDVIGLSILSGAHLALVPRIVELLRTEGLDDVLVLVGGIIPDEDVPTMHEMGVSGVFGPGTNTEDIVNHIKSALAARPDA